MFEGKAISGDCTRLAQPDTHPNFDLLWSAVLARQSIMVLLLSEEVPGCSCVSLAKRGCLKAIMSTSMRLLRLPDWRRTWQGQKSQLKTLEGCVWLLRGHKVTADFYLQRTTVWINSKTVEIQQTKYPDLCAKPRWSHTAWVRIGLCLS